MSSRSVRRIAAVAATGLAATGLVAAVPGADARPVAPKGGETVAVVIKHHKPVMPSTTLAPGVAHFVLTTHSKKSLFQVVQLLHGYTAKDALRDAAKLYSGKAKPVRRFDRNTDLLGGVQLAKGTTADAYVRLRAGKHYLALDQDGPQKLKNVTKFVVKGASVGGSLATRKTLKAVRDISWGKKPKSIPHQGVVGFKNTADQPHFIVTAKLKKGKTFKDFKMWIQGGAQGPAPVKQNTGFDSGALSPGAKTAFSYDVPKGKYVVVCFWPSDTTMGNFPPGTPHAFMGMYRELNVK